MEQKNILWIGLAIVVAVILISSNPSILQRFAVTEGYSSLSISNVQLVDEGARIRIFGVANGAEQISIDFTPSKLNEFLNEKGLSATKSVVGSIKLENPTREFKIDKNDEKPFYKYEYRDFGILKNCANNAPSGMKSNGRIGPSTCLYSYLVGSYSSFSSGQYTDNTPVNFDIGGSIGTLNPTSGDTSIILNDGKTKVEWVGNLVNFQSIETPGYGVLYKNSQFVSLIDIDAYTLQNNYWNAFAICIDSKQTTRSNWAEIFARIDGFGNLLGGIFKSDTASRACVDTLNNNINNILTDKRQLYANQINTDSVEFTSNGLKVNLDAPTVFPTFIITLDATKVGIIELKGKPEIISCSEDKVYDSGETYSTSVQVKNIGANDGSFYLKVTCADGASGTGSEKYVEKGETTNLKLQVSGTNTVSGTQNKDCTIKVIDRKSGDSDSCTFTLGVKYVPNRLCSPNKITCKDSTHLQTCNTDGTNFVLKECECIVLESGEAKCKVEGNGTIPPEQKACKWYEEETVDTGTLGWRKVFDFIPGVSPIYGCRTASWFYLAIIGATVVLIVYIQNNKRGGRRRR